MKTKNKLLMVCAVLLSLCSIAFFIGITYGQFQDYTYKYRYIIYFEKEAYMLCGLCYLLFYRLIIEKFKNHKSKILAGLGTSALCTVQVFLLNNLWMYISFNDFFDWVGPARYSLFLIGDLTYTQNGNGFKYPMVFLLMFAACIFVAFLLRRIINFYDDVFFSDNKSDGAEDK